jgi:hypothetical protein
MTNPIRPVWGVLVLFAARPPPCDKTAWWEK